jgi:hypothetical protein
MAKRNDGQQKGSLSGAAVQAASSQYAFQVLNLAEMRAQRSLRRPVIVDQNGKAHDLAGLPLDTYLGFLEFEELQREMAAEEGEDRMTPGRQKQLLERMRALIVSVLPDFPVAGLYLHELSMVAQAIQVAVVPSAMAEAASEAGQGN